MLLEILSLAKDLIFHGVPPSVTAMQRSERVVSILNQLGMAPNSPPRDFQACYTRAFVEFGVEDGKSEAIMDYFRTIEVQDAFRRFYETGEASRPS